MVELTPSTIAAISGGERFRSIEETPAQAIALGMATIMAAKRVFLVATGVGKADAVHRMVEGRVGPGVPASFLTAHHDLTVVVDQDAGVQLDPDTIKGLA